MPTHHIPFSKTGYFSSLICDYLAEKSELQSLYHRFPKLEHFEKQIQEKKAAKHTNVSERQVLKTALQTQYVTTDASEKTIANIERLADENTFTVTTGHQLNLFTGPLYFLYKIISTINLAEQLQEAYPGYHFVPIYWMASEDHDFDEINYFNFKGKKVQWNREASGAVGKLSTAGLAEVFEVFSADLGKGTAADFLRSLFKEGYLKHDNLTDATRYIANALFKEYGLVIVDGDDKALKQLFVPFVLDELTNKTAHQKVNEAAKQLKEISPKYKIQVNPREINLFYIHEGIRERIVEEEGVYSVLNTDITWSLSEITTHVHEFPERFSPNALLRPLYQEVILPNLCYIGGGGELAYWLELKSYFDTVAVTFPMLLLRNSVVIASEKQAKKLQNLDISYADIFLKRNDFINRRIRRISNINIDFSEQKAQLKHQFEAMYALAKQTDASFLGAVEAQEKKQLKGIAHLEKRMLKAQKRVLKDEVIRMSALQEALFPQQSLQERKVNFSELYLDYGTALIPNLHKTLKPLDGTFTIIEM